MEYIFQLLNGESNSQTPDNQDNTNQNTTQNNVQPDAEPQENFEPFRYGFSIPISAIILNSSPLDEAVRGDLNGTDLIEDIDTLDPSRSHLFAINIQPNNLDLLKRLNQTLLMYRKGKLAELTVPEKINCCICFTDKDYAVNLKCKHNFCLDCIIKIVFDSNRNTCPLCRDIFIN